jgi:hypothetical protein
MGFACLTGLTSGAGFAKDIELMRKKSKWCRSPKKRFFCLVTKQEKGYFDQIWEAWVHPLERIIQHGVTLAWMEYDMKTLVAAATGLLVLGGCGAVESTVEKVQSPTSKKKVSNCQDEKETSKDSLISEREAELMAKAKTGFGERNADLCAHSFTG